MDGIINVLKPPGMTSHDVVQFIRRNLKESKVGHTGTLDPGVAGVLPLCLGKATRVAEFITAETKRYRAVIKMGITTTTQDAFGEVLQESDASWVKKEDLLTCFEKFTGRIQQVPPMVSAVKVKGKKLYELARQGIEVARPPREIEVYSLTPISFVQIGDMHPEVMFDIVCSKGTYVRTLCHDIGKALGCGAHMSYLIRTQSGAFVLDEALTLEEIIELWDTGNIHLALCPIDSAISFMPMIVVRDSALKSVGHGNKLYPQGVEAEDAEISEGKLVRLKNNEGKLLAIARVLLEENEVGSRRVYQPVKVF